MNLSEIAEKLKISVQSLKRFIEDFHLDIQVCVEPSGELKPEFEAFLNENQEFLKKYEADLKKDKSVAEISDKIKQPREKVEEAIENSGAKIYDNGIFKSTVSSFGIDHQLGGNYQFIYNYFDQSTKLTHRDFIGYRDLYFYLADAVQPFIGGEETKNWGIQKPAGIILYGPPGSGKIFWAKKIAEITKYQLKEVKQHYLGATFVDGTRENFNHFLVNVLKQENVLLFLENFNEIMQEKSIENHSGLDAQETKEIILHYINKFEKEGVLVVGSANYLEGIDSEILAPGRFDVLIPVFPPNAEERAELLLYHMAKGLDKDAELLEILKNSQADSVPFWRPISAKMKVFSNTMLIDFTQSLKKKIRKQFFKNQSKTITEKLLMSALKDATAKLTPDYLNKVDQFLTDVKNNNEDDFQNRIFALENELETYKLQPPEEHAIGFHPNN